MRYDPTQWELLIRQCRRIGKTYAAVKGAQAAKAVLVCETEQQARAVRSEYGPVETVSIERIERLLGRRCAFVFDPEAVAGLLGEMRRQLEAAEAERHAVLRRPQGDLNANLLEPLKWLLSASEDPTQDPRVVLAIARERARDAIAKAEGVS